MNPTSRPVLWTLALLAGAAYAQEPTPVATGGVRLVYELPIDALQRSLADQPNLDLEQLLARTVRTLAKRVGDEAEVTRTDATGFTVDLKASAKIDLQELRQRIENVGKLDLRIVASDAYERDGVSFDLDKERKHLQRWLDDGGRDRLQADPLAIEAFRAVDAEHLRWVPRVLRPRKGNETRWDRSYAAIPTLQAATVQAFRDDDWNKGQVPAALARSAAPFLVELIALNWHEKGFSEADIDPTRTKLTQGRNGSTAIAYAIVPQRVGEYAEWSENYTRQCSGIVVNGELLSAPQFMGRIPGRGILEGDFTEAEAQNLVRGLQTGPLPIAPRLVSQATLPAKTTGK